MKLVQHGTDRMMRPILRHSKLISWLNQAKSFEIWDEGRFLNLLQLMLQKHDDATFSVAVSVMRHGFGMSFYFFLPKITKAF